MYFLSVKPDLPIVIYCDNAGAIFLSNNQESRLSKHLDTKVHFIRNFVQDGVIKVVFVSGVRNYADPFTKNVDQMNMKRNFDYMAQLKGFSDV